MEPRRSRHYILDDARDPVPVPMDVWATSFNDLAARQVGVLELGEVMVSTVFLGLDHNFFMDGPPILFETMIFGGELAEYQRRYATWDEAERGHQEAVRYAFPDLNPALAEQMAADCLARFIKNASEHPHD